MPDLSKPNPVLARLGFAADERLVVLHADDIGVFQSTVAAYAELVEAGVLSAASVMVPCPWFPAAASFCREKDVHAQVDMGVHLTLTCEWQPYRWGPISTADGDSGLLDEEGYFHRSSTAVQRAADPKAVAKELRTQLQHALAAGIDVTHLDAHMFTLFHHRFVQSYIDLAFEFGIPAFFPRRLPADLGHFGDFGGNLPDFTQLVESLEERGLPLFDQVVIMPLDQPHDRAAQLIDHISGLPAGLSYLICHPAKDTPELRAAIPAADWPNRVADYETFRDGNLRHAIEAEGVHVIGYRLLRDLFRAR